MSNPENTAESVDQQLQATAQESLIELSAQSNIQKSTAQCAVKGNIESPWMERIGKLVSMAFVLFVGAQALAMIACVGVLQWAWMHDSVVEKTAIAGRVIVATQTGGVLDHGMVETDLGYYFLTSPLSVPKQGLLNLEFRADHSRYLCDSERHCSKLVSWY